MDSHADSKQSLRSIHDRFPGNLDLALLQDNDHKVIDRYGLLYSTSWGGLPYPATYVIDRKGIIRWRFIETNYRQRPSNQQVRNALSQLK